MIKMKLGGKIVIGIILFALIIKTQSITTPVSWDNQPREQLNLALSLTSPKLLDLSLTTHEPIVITNDVDFITYGFPGAGIEGDPYIIENYNITTTAEKSISITSTIKYFVIRNCYVDAANYGIYVSNVAEGTAYLTNNFCYFNNIGIGLNDLSGANVTNNVCSENYYGIVPGSNSEILISNNTCNDNICGIYGSNNGASIIGNICNNNIVVGIHSGGSDLTVTDNICNYNEEWGIHLWGAGGALVANNSCSNNERVGIDLEKAHGSTVMNNTCCNNRYGIDSSDSAGSILMNNSFYNNGLGPGISLASWSGWSIENNWVNDKILGFYANLLHATFSEPIYGQLFFINCINIVISNQVLSNASVGIFLDECADITISNCICNNNSDEGIWITDSQDLTLSDNICNNNKGRSGIDLGRSSEATLTNNTCSNNNETGIYLSSSSCLITNNSIQKNWGYGVEIYGADNSIHHNSFIDNNLGGNSQALDNGENNIWYDEATEEGNYWSEWNKKRSYSIDGDAKSKDRYPLNENLERTNYEFIILIPSIILVASLYSIIRKRKQRSKK